MNLWFSAGAFKHAHIFGELFLSRAEPAAYALGLRESARLDPSQAPDLDLIS